jgi:hypothetical protein
VRIVEVGAGTGTMVDRLVRWRLVGHGRPATIVAVDEDGDAIAAAERAYAHRRGALARAGVAVDFVCSTLADVAQREAGRFDLVVAHHVLDLLRLDEAVPQAQALAAPGGMFWFTLTFDGRTRWLPPLDRRLDATIEARYHASMDERDRTRHSQAGRRLAAAIEAVGGAVAVAGASWWRIVPSASGYRAGERVVLETILAFHGAELAGNLPSAQWEWWLRERKAQLAAGRLGLLVRHRDVAGWFASPSTGVQPVSARSALSSA